MHINPSHGAHDTLSRPESVHLIQEKASIRTRVLAARHKIHSSFIDIFCLFSWHTFIGREEYVMTLGMGIIIEG